MAQSHQTPGPGHAGAFDPRRFLAVIAATVGCAMVLAACGSGGGSGDTATGKAAPVIRFANCMRSHGVPSFPDPSSGGGINITPQSGINPQSPAFQSAMSTCSKLLPGGGPGRRGTSESRKLAMVKLARCMREHGLPSFPDPTSTPPSPGSGGIGLAFGSPGSFIAVPQTLLQSPAFRQAASACGFPGARGGGPRKAFS